MEWGSFHVVLKILIWREALCQSLAGQPQPVPKLSGLTLLWMKQKWVSSRECVCLSLDSVGLRSTFEFDCLFVLGYVVQAGLGHAM